MAGVAGYKTVLLKTGTPTSMSSQAMSTVAGSTTHTYQIDSTARTVWDRDTTPTFYQRTSTGGSTAISSTAISSIDYLFGKVTLSVSSTAITTPVRVSGNYLPKSNVVGANDYTLTISANMADDTDFSSTGFRSRFPTIKDVSVTISRYDSLENDFYEKLSNESNVVVEVRPGGSTSKSYRGFFYVESDNRSGGVEDIENGDITLQMSEDGTGKTFSIDTPK